MIRFRLFGIPFEVGAYFWILSAILGPTSGISQGNRGLILLAIWMACVFVSIVVHELGHALMARRFGMSPYIALQGLGGVTYYSPGGALTRPQGMLITLAGPAAGLALWFLTRYVVVGLLSRSGSLDDITFYAVQYLLFINLYWTLFNLLPILPLDGGQFVRNLVGPRYAFAARMLGGTVAVVVCVLCLRAGQIYAAVFLAMLAFANFRNPVKAGPAI
jgi:stage IV sporulation protein FB